MEGNGVASTHLMPAAFRCRCCCSRFGTVIARKAEHATEVIVRLAKRRDAKAVVCGTEKRRENLQSRMSKPKRIQRSRAKGWKMPANAIYVGRPTVWGNPYVVGSELMNGETLNAEKAVALYEQHLADNFNERDIRHCLREQRSRLLVRARPAVPRRRAAADRELAAEVARRSPRRAGFG